jgi:FtsP/CotA-like multicopper oxidase with cupredoxin domain
VKLNDYPPDGVSDGTAKLLIAPAERADVIVDFRVLSAGASFRLLNLGPDEPFGGFPVDVPANPGTTGQVMEFRVVPRAAGSPGPNAFTDPGSLVLPAITPLSGGATVSLSLNEMMSMYPGLDGPAAAMLGTMVGGAPVHKMWMDPVTENPAVGATQVWEFHNFTADAHPIHIHQVQFQVVNREVMGGSTRLPEAWESGFKDTVIAYPGEITRVRSRFDIPGQFVWHCHIVEHEDNEMMRPFRVG